MRNKFVCPCSIKTHALGFDRPWHFLPPAGCESVFPANGDVETLEEVVVSW